MKNPFTWFVLFSGYLMATSSVHSQPNQVKAYYRQLQKETNYQPITLNFVRKDDGLVDDFGKLSQIILVRHGEPKLKNKGWRNRQDAKRYIVDYDSVGIYPPAFIPVDIRDGEVDKIYTSSINRSISTARLVFEQEDWLHSDSLFREFERKIFAFPNIKLPTKWWLAGSRVLWFLGMNNRGIERFSEAKARARRAAGVLEKDSIEQGKTLLVSHGLLNHFLSKYLKQRGWKQVYDGGNGYLSQKMFVKYRD